MADPTDSIVITNNKAKIVLDWDDGQWYVSDIDYSGDDDTNTDKDPTTTVSSGGVKVADWDTSYKYSKNDIVSRLGSLYVSGQNQNQGNIPEDGTFWWSPVVDLKNVDAITLEGKNFNEIVKAVLGGNLITDYYTKSETNTLLLSYFNNVNAKKLGDWTLDAIQSDYKSKINTSTSTSKNYVETYLNDDSVSSFDQAMVTVFNASIATDNINQI